MQRVIFGAEHEFAAVPGAERLAARVVERPTLAGLHAGLMDLGFEQIIVVAHHDAVQRVNHLALIAINVEHAARAIFLLGAIRILAIVRDGQKGSAETVEMGDSRRIGVLGRLFGGDALGAPRRRVDALTIPARLIGDIGQPTEKSADIRIRLRIESHRVVDVVSRLPPRVEDDFFESVVGMQRRDDALHRIIEERAADAPFFDARTAARR